MPLATDRDPSGVKQKNLALTTGPQIGSLFLATHQFSGKTGGLHQPYKRNTGLIGESLTSAEWVIGKIGPVRSCQPAAIRRVRSP